MPQSPRAVPPGPPTRAAPASPPRLLLCRPARGVAADRDGLVALDAGGVVLGIVWLDHPREPLTCGEVQVYGGRHSPCPRLDAVSRADLVGSQLPHEPASLLSYLRAAGCTRVTARSSRPRGTCWPPIAPTRFRAPGITTRLPRSRPSIPAFATSSALAQNASGKASSPSSATSANSVFTGPGQSAVTETPEPLSSACRDSVKLSTNAFVAA